jgi:hypothetical protein
VPQNKDNRYSKSKNTASLPYCICSPAFIAKKFNSISLLFTAELLAVNLLHGVYLDMVKLAADPILQSKWALLVKVHGYLVFRMGVDISPSLVGLYLHDIGGSDHSTWTMW